MQRLANSHIDVISHATHPGLDKCHFNQVSALVKSSSETDLDVIYKINKKKKKQKLWENVLQQKENAVWRLLVRGTWLHL